MCAVIVCQLPRYYGFLPAVDSVSGAIWSLEASASRLRLVALCATRLATFDLCFQGRDLRLISFQAALVTAGLSLYDTPV